MKQIYSFDRNKSKASKNLCIIRELTSLRTLIFAKLHALKNRWVFGF